MPEWAGIGKNVLLSVSQSAVFYRIRSLFKDLGQEILTGPMTLRSSTSKAFSMGAFSGSSGGGRMRVGRSLPSVSDIFAFKF